MVWIRSRISRAPKTKHIKQGHPNIGHVLNKRRQKHIKEGPYAKPSATLHVYRFVYIYIYTYMLVDAGIHALIESFRQGSCTMSRMQGQETGQQAVAQSSIIVLVKLHVLLLSTARILMLWVLGDMTRLILLSRMQPCQTQSLNFI